MILNSKILDKLINSGSIKGWKEISKLCKENKIIITDLTYIHILYSIENVVNKYQK